MKMKKFVVTTISVAFVMFLMINNVEAQKKYVTKAQIWAENGEKLDTALKAVEFAEKQEKTQDWAKTYYVKGLVYDAIAKTENAEFKKICDKPLVKSFENFKKAYDMKGGSAYQNAIDLKLINLANGFVEKAINKYNEQDYESSYLYFAKSLEVKEMPIFDGAIDTAILFNTAVAAQRIEKWDEAINYYNKILVLEYEGGNTYVLLADCYKGKGDTESYLNTLKAGFEKYPGNADLIGGIINYFLLEAENSEGAFDYIKVAREKDPTNPRYYSAEAHLHNKLGDFDKAKENYKKAIELDAELFEAQYNLGVIYFNEAIELRDAANEIVDNDEYQAAKVKVDAKFMEALPYVETSYNLSPDDSGIMNTLKNLYYLLKMTDKYDELNAKMSE